MNKEKEELKKLTIVTQQDLDEGVWDAEHKGLYSKDGKRFLQYVRPKDLEWGTCDSFSFKSGVEVICEKAFSRYHSPLESLVIPDSVVAIGEEAFQQVRLPHHSRITINKELKYIGYHILGNFHGIIDLVIEEGIKEIDLGYILDCAPAVTLYLPSTLEHISENGFGECDGTELIHLAKGNKHFRVENGILYNYAKTKLFRCPITKRGELRIPEGVTTIGANAFRLSGYEYAINAEPEPKLSVILPKSLKKIEVGAFRHTWIDSLYIPANVNEIAEAAFENPIHLTVEVSPDNEFFEVSNNLLIDKRDKKVLLGMSNNIEIPDDIKEIGDYALTHLEAKSIVIPKGVTRIGHHNLNLNTMTQISLPSTLQNISRESFWGFVAEPHDIIVPTGMGDVFKDKLYGDDYDIRSYIKEISKNLIISDDGKTVLGVHDNSITSIEIPFGIEVIGERAFDGCWLLREMVLPESVKQIERWAFSGCKYLRKINLPAQLTEIEQGSFDKCEFLESINIPKTVKSIGDFAFSGCKSLRRITLPQGLSSIGDRAFSDCNSLKKIIIPGSVKSLGNWAFWYCKRLKDIVLNEGLEEMDGAFPGCISVKSINLPNSLKEIEGYSLHDFEKLKVIRLSEDNPHFRFIDGVLYSRDLRKIIRVMAYLEGTIYVPRSVRAIGCLAFDGCKHITKVVIPDSVKTIERMAFRDCISLKEVILPKNLKEIDSHCFAGCKQLSGIKIPNSVREIDWCCFYGCVAMRSIHLPDSLKELGTNVFPRELKEISVSPNCRNYTTVDGVLYNKDMTELVAFPKNSEITHFVVPNSVKKLGYDAFWYCKKLKSIKLPDGLVVIGNDSFSNCRSLKSISLPDGIKTIPDSAFENCKSLKKVKLPSHLRELGEKAFFLCDSLGSITLPKSLKRIGEFSIPKTIREIHIPFRDPQEVAPRFYLLRSFSWDNESEIKIIVPKGSKNKYLENDFWANWLTIEEEKD